MRKVLFTCLVAAVVAAPAQANDGGGKGRALKITGSIVRMSDTAVAVENKLGDAVLTCAVPERLAEKASAFKVGDQVRMFCVRYRGRRAQLLKLQRVDERGKVAKPAEKQHAAGPIAELGAGAIVVQSAEGRLACRVPEEKQAKLAGLKVGDKVKIVCADGVLAGLERYEPVEKPAGEEVRLYGAIAALSRSSVTVQGEAGSLTCSVPAGWAEKLATRFAVGDRVKMMCRGTELTYLEKI
ncbi:MAG: hypothetical protein HOQ03_12345 [Thermoleophilia bacterium]|nr:hypothetical protein [Thermoleophilia bacterium]